ncbi:MAG: hypothetical protein FWC55_02200 [Firmicutes bacterium]|nr:hypothetical protein [Bacillota bacterium]
MLIFSKINVLSSFGREANNLLVTHDSASERLVALFPGANNTCESPLLYYAREVALQAGCDVLSVEYGYSRAGLAFAGEMFAPSLEESVEALRLCRLEKYSRVSFIGKSLGTLIAGEAAKRFPGADIKFLFLTPVPSSIPYIKGDCTVIYGTADRHFSEADAARIPDDPRIKRLVLPGAGHSLEKEGDCAASLGILGLVCEAYETFLRGDGRKFQSEPSNT